MYIVSSGPKGQILINSLTLGWKVYALLIVDFGTVAESPLIILNVAFECFSSNGVQFRRTNTPQSVTLLPGLFAYSHMDFDVDRNTTGTGDPSLAEMTIKALRILKRNPKGFFLFVEGNYLFLFFSVLLIIYITVHRKKKFYIALKIFLLN